jgi:hypothetical protein
LFVAGGSKSASSTTSNCTILKNAILNAKEEEGFLCLPDGECFPVSVKERVNIIPSKLLIRDFHSELSLIVAGVRNRRKKMGNNGGGVFFGPSGTGKSWASMVILRDELTASFSPDGDKRAVVYFDAPGQRTFVFSKDRNVKIEAIESPNVFDIPELLQHSTVLIYDAVRGTKASLTVLPCEIFIFASPNAGNFKQSAENSSLERFVCPNWTKIELKALAHGYGDRIPPEEVEKRFERFGGSPRAVVANSLEISESKVLDAAIILKGIKPWSDFSAMNEDWPSSLLKARYQTTELATNANEAYNKYVERNVLWDYSCAHAKEMVHAKYEQAEEVTKLGFETWLKNEKKAAALYGYFFEYRVHLLFASSGKEDVEYKTLIENKGLSEQQQKIVVEVMSKVNRNLTWKYPAIKRIETLAMDNVSKDDQISELKKLTDTSVVYRLPPEFPLIDFFNPPNNCFSLGVGDHKIKLDPVLKLCNALPATQQVNFVYLTPTANYENVKRWQSFQKSNAEMSFGKLPFATMQSLARMVQFCMKFKRF